MVTCQSCCNVNSTVTLAKQSAISEKQKYNFTLLILIEILVSTAVLLSIQNGNDGNNPPALTD